MTSVASMKDKFHVAVLNYPQGLREAAEAIHFGLLEAGYDSFYSTGLKQFSDFPERRKIILAPKLGKVLREGFPGIDWRTLVRQQDVVYNAEQLREGLLEAHEMSEIFRERTIWDYSTCNIAFLQRLGCPEAVFVPLGTVNELQRIPRREYDADVMFYGTTNSRRQVVLDELRNSGLTCRFFDQTTRIWGQERDELISRSKIILNLHYYDLRIFEVFRTFYPLLNGKCVVSEDGIDGNQTFYQDAVVFTKYDAIVETVIRIAKDQELLQRQEDQAAHAMSQLRQADILKSALHAQ